MTEPLVGLEIKVKFSEHLFRIEIGNAWSVNIVNAFF